ncbi:TetR/AcrR family transcriptional regulator [Leifsonia sp. A12D58]|uniref:TetR/AcrR family transcriptional regulator n=1 Tax=Leifsonia sp. A12D58 TaxID=3397674 RepID=UPI0039E0774D
MPAPATPLTVDAIVSAAVVIADSDGLDAVSMRRVAAAFNVSAMALYRHVDDRDALLFLMAGAAVRDFPLLPTSDASWRELLVHMADANWGSFEAHPWLLRIVLTPDRLLNMATLDQLETLLGKLHDAGLPLDEGFDCLLGISALAIGAASIVFAANPGGTGTGGAEPGFETGRTGRVIDGWSADARSSHPIAARFHERGITRASTHRALDFTVQNFLDGVELRIETLRTPPVPDAGQLKGNP